MNPPTVTLAVLRDEISSCAKGAVGGMRQTRCPTGGEGSRPRTLAVHGVNLQLCIGAGRLSGWRQTSSGSIVSHSEEGTSKESLFKFLE